jgi:hypothetical protein
LRTKGELEDKSAILIVADNDDDPAKAFADIQAQIRSAEKLGVPDKPRQRAPSTAPLPPVAVLMLPWDDVAGCLETLCYQASSKKWPRNGECVEDFIKCTGIGGWVPQSLSKAKMNGMIASICEEDPATSMQYVWSRKQNIVPVDDPCFEQIANYLSTF